MMLVGLFVLLPLVFSQPDYILWQDQDYSTNVFEGRWLANCAEFAVDKNRRTLYLHGGKSANPTGGNPVILGDVWVSRDGAKSWKARNPNAMHPNAAPNTAGGGLQLTNNQKLIAFGGLKQNSDMNYVVTNEVFWSANEGRDWNQNANAPWAARWAFGHVLIPGSNIIVMTGGFTKDAGLSDLPNNEVWLSFDGYGKQWVQRAVNAEFSARGQHSMAVLGDATTGSTLVLVGGFDGISGDNGFASDVYVSTDMGSHWNLVNKQPGFAPRIYANLVDFAGILYYFGGEALPNYDGSIPANGAMLDSGVVVFTDTWYSLDNGLTWLENPPNINMRPRYSACASVVSKGRLVYYTGTLDEGSGVNLVQVASLADTEPKQWQHWKTVNATQSP